MTKVRDVMTAEPIVLQQDQTIADAAQAMRDTAVGAVLVVDGDRLCGLITDRDIVVRAVAESALPDSPVGPLVSPDLIAVGADDEADDAARVMQAHAVRRLRSWTTAVSSASCPSATWPSAAARIPPWPTSAPPSPNQ